MGDKGRGNRWTRICFLVSVLALLQSGHAWAEVKLHRLGQALPVTLESSVSGQHSAVGDAFQAKLSDDVRYKQSILPAGTLFRGQVAEIRHSHRFGRPGYVALNVEEATLPSGESLRFSPDRYKPRPHRVHHPDTYTFPEAVATQLPYTAAAAAVLVPISAVAEVTSAGLLIAGEGIRMGVGGVAGLFREKYRADPKPRRFALGALDGSGVPRVVGFFSLYPEPEFQPGDAMKLHLPPGGLRDLLQKTAASKAPVRSSAN